MNRPSFNQTTERVCGYIAACRQFIAVAKLNLRARCPTGPSAPVATLCCLETSLAALERSHDLLMRTPDLLRAGTNEPDLKVAGSERPSTTTCAKRPYGDVEIKNLPCSAIEKMQTEGAAMKAMSNATAAVDQGETLRYELIVDRRLSASTEDAQTDARFH